MKVTAIKTPVIQAGEDITKVISKAITKIPERSVLVVASKLASTCENRFVPKVTGDKEEKYKLVRQEADDYMEPTSSSYDIMLTIKGNWMFVNAGIDESNAAGQYLLWPKDLQKSVNQIWHFLRQHYGVKEVGVTLSDSSSFPLNWGVVGVAITYCGFNPLRSYIGTKDLHGRVMKMERVNVMQAVTVAGAYEMGEGNESTPMAIVEDIKDIEFLNHAPTTEELQMTKVGLDEDIFAPILTAVDWKSSKN